MFTRLKRKKGSSSVSVQIVENTRVGNTTKQCVIRHVGTAHTEEELEQLKRLAHALKLELEQEQQERQQANIISKKKKPKSLNPNTIDVLSLEERERRILGISDIYGHVYETLGFGNLFTRPLQRATSAQILKDIVLARIANPQSKRASVEFLETHFGISYKLEHVYQMMDKIDDVFCERIQQRALSMTLKLTGETLRVLFYDATTLYFESFSEDDLKCNGYSKDLKFNQPQVLLALFVTEKGLPVGYDVFPGNTFEGHTLIPMLDKLKARYQLEKVVFVADRGLLSEENLKALEERGISYIVGARIKNTSQKLQMAILQKEDYQKSEQHEDQLNGAFDYGQNRYLYVNYSPNRAAKDRHDREKAIQKLHAKIAKSKNPKSLLSNYGYKKYLHVEGEATLKLNTDKMESDSKWDGLAGVVTNISESTPEAIWSHYRGLWQIEACFRVQKHDLRIRPIYHWTPKRVKAHIAISFMAFVCIRYLEYRLSIQSQKLSPEEIRKALMMVQASVIHDVKNGKNYLLPTPVNTNAKEIYRILKMTPLSKITPLKRGASSKN